MLRTAVGLFTFALALTLCLLPASVSFAQTKTPVEGVWRVAEFSITGATAASNSNPEPGLFIFTRGYFSVAIVDHPRLAVAPAKDPPRLTEAEKIARYEEWVPFHANSGTYEIKGSTLIRRPIVAKNAVNVTSPPITQEFELDGPNTLWLIERSAPGRPARETRIKLARVE
jgi:hypothetical protein